MIVTLLRKPLEGTVAENTLKHGCGAINIDATRIGGGVPRQATAGNRTVGWGVQKGGCSYEKGTGVTFTNQGRWPANFILIGDSPVQELDRQSGIKTSTSHYSYKRSNGDFIDKIPDMVEKSHWRTETGGASRFFKQFQRR